MSRNDRLDGIKLQLLYVLKGTALAGLLPDGDGIRICGDSDTFPRGYIRLNDGVRLPQYTLDEYAALVCGLIRMLPEGTAVHRVTGDPPKRDLILPLWTADKKRVLNTIRSVYSNG